MTVDKDGAKVIHQDPPDPPFELLWPVAVAEPLKENEMTNDSWYEFERQILAGKIPSIVPEEPWFTYVQIPDVGGSRAELFGFSFYHLYISDDGDNSYSIRFKDVRHAGNPWQQIKLNAPNIDELHQRLTTFCAQSICAVMREEIQSNSDEPSRHMQDDPFQVFKKHLSKHADELSKLLTLFDKLDGRAKSRSGRKIK